MKLAKLCQEKSDAAQRAESIARLLYRWATRWLPKPVLLPDHRPDGHHPGIRLRNVRLWIEEIATASSTPPTRFLRCQHCDWSLRYALPCFRLDQNHGLENGALLDWLAGSLCPVGYLLCALFSETKSDEVDAQPPI